MNAPDGQARAPCDPSPRPPRSSLSAGRHSPADSDGSAAPGSTRHPPAPATARTGARTERSNWPLVGSWPAYWRTPRRPAFGPQSKMWAAARVAGASDLHRDRLALDTRAGATARPDAGAGSDAQLLVDQLRRPRRRRRGPWSRASRAPRSGRSPWRCPRACAAPRRDSPRAPRRRSRPAHLPRRSPRRPSARTISAGSPPSATSLSSTCRPAPTLIRFAATSPTSAASASARTREAAGSSSSARRLRQVGGDPVRERLRRRRRVCLQPRAPASK